MSAKITNIAKNTSYFTLALILQKIISFTYFTLIARALGPEDLGRYYFAVSFTSIFAIFIDLGMANVLTRESAKDNSRAGDYFANIFALKIPLAVLSLVIVMALVHFLGYPVLTRELVYISSISMILDSFTLVFFAVIRGSHNFLYESISSVVFQLVVLASGTAILHYGLGLRWLIGALALASLVNCLYALILLKRKFRIRIVPRFDRELAMKLIAITAPFALAAIFNRVYVYSDSVLLSHLAGDRYVGLYQVSFKIIFAIQFLPMAFTATLYPAMSSYWQNNREQLSITFERAMNYLIIISLPIAIGTIALADKIIFIFKSGYADAVLPLRIAMVALPFIFVGFPIGSLLNACDRQKKNTANVGLATLTSVLLNFFLIPKFQAAGASATVLLTNILMFVLGMRLVPGIIKLRAGKIGRTFGLSLLGGAVMGMLSCYLKDYLNIFAVVAVSAGVYFLFLFVLRVFRKDDVLGVYQSFRRKEAA